MKTVAVPNSVNDTIKDGLWESTDVKNISSWIEVFNSIGYLKEDWDMGICFVHPTSFEHVIPGYD